MDKRGRKIGNFLRISLILISILLGVFAQGAWAQPYVVDQTPPDGATNILINTAITIQFNTTMDTASAWFELDKEGELEVTGNVQWKQTVFPNDTLVFVPQKALNPATHYRYEGNVQSETGGVWVEGSFITKPSSADTTPPTVQTVYPRNGMTNVSTGETIIILFSEPMNPNTINSTNITISGLSSTEYSVTYDLGDGDVEIRKNTPFSPSPAIYTVTITTNVRDVRGNPLKNQYSWSFQTGAADITAPTVTQTVPTNGDIKVSLFPMLYAFFSEEMDESTFNDTNIKLYDNTALTGVPIYIYNSYEDYVEFGLQSALTYGHQYTATIGTGVKDRNGNISLSSQYTWSFTTASNSGIDSDPVFYDGADRDEQRGQRWVDGSTRVQFEVSAWDEVTFPLLLTATTSGHAPWTLNPTGDYNYSYESAGDEGLSAGNHTVDFTIQDGALNTVTFQRNIYIFSTTPTLSFPANGATGVSTTPTFEWSYSGGDRPMYYNVAIFDGPDINEDHTVWMGYMVDLGSGTQSITIPADKQLAPNTTYYWGVRGANRDENGETIAGLRSFTTGGTPPPPASFTNVLVRSDNRTGGMRWNLRAMVRGPSPADITELKVTGPGDFQYIFTEDDINQNEQYGLYYYHDIFSPLSNGTYTFSVTDSQGRTVTATADFTNVSIPIVATGTMEPGDNTYVNSTTPTFNWDSVGEGYYYRIQIFDWNSLEKNVYMSPYSQDTQATVPAGYLLASTPYKWRVEAYDPTYQNRSASDMLRFSTGDPSYVLDLNYGLVWSDNNYYGGQRKVLNALVIGPLPSHIHSSPGYLFVDGPGGFGHLFSGAEVGHGLTPGSPYSYSEPGFPLNGDYTFSVMDINSATDTPIVKNVTTAEIPIVDQATMLPANNAYLSSLTQTFSWAAVSGSNRYYRVTINDWSLRYPIYQSTRSGVNSVTIPSGILKPNRSYKWRVEVFDAASGGAADNRSSSAWNCFTTPRNWLIDFNADGMTDIAVYRVSTGAWFVNPSNGEPPYGVGFGGDPSDYPVAGDYDGDGKNDHAVYRHNTGAWWIYPSSTGVSGIYGIGFGGDATDVPIPFDYDGDGKSDIAIYRISTGAWFIYPSSTGPAGIYGVGFGGDASDIPVPGDYDGDGKADIAIYRKSTGAWWIYPSSTGPAGIYGVGFGGDASDVPVPGDYDGDGKTDFAIYRASAGAWWIYPSSTGPSGIYGVGFGGDVTDKPVPGDYDSDGKTDLAIYRAGAGSWFIYPSRGGLPWGVIFGGDASDLPVTTNPATYM